MTELSPEAREAAHAVKNAQQVVEAAREAQLHKAVELSAERNREVLTDVLRDVFGEHQNSGRFIDTTKIPFICKDIELIKVSVSKLEDNLTWIVRLVIGGVIAAVLAILFK